MHQLPCGDRAKGVSDGAAARRAVACTLQQVHLESRVVLLFQVRTHLSELRQLQPAGLRGAAARHPVALTRAFHGALHRLGRELRVRGPGLRPWGVSPSGELPGFLQVYLASRLGTFAQSNKRLDGLSAPRPGSRWSQAPDSMGCRTHLAASLVVVQVHGCPSILSRLQGIDELLGYCLSKAHVVTAASPQPALAPWETWWAERPLSRLHGASWATGSKWVRGIGEGFRWGECPRSRLVSPQIYF